MRLDAPTIPFVSAVTGNWISPAEASDPDYWTKHLQGAAKFSEGIELLRLERPIFLEIGSGRTLSTFVRQLCPDVEEPTVFSALTSRPKTISDMEALLESIGSIYACGAHVNWSQFFFGERRRRIPLPTYCFDRQFFGIG